jgi:hypothetical protein
MQSGRLRSRLWSWEAYGRPLGVVFVKGSAVFDDRVGSVEQRTCIQNCQSDVLPPELAVPFIDETEAIQHKHQLSALQE